MAVPIAEIFRPDGFVRTSPLTVEATETLPNGVEMHATVFGPKDGGERVCTMSICYPTCPSERHLRMVNTIRDITRAVREISPRYPSLIRVVLFGSFARGEQTEGSDVDIVAEFSQDGPYTEKLDFYSDLKDLLGRELDMITSLVGAPRYFVDGIMRDGMKLYERD